MDDDVLSGLVGVGALFCSTTSFLLLLLCSSSRWCFSPYSSFSAASAFPARQEPGGLRALRAPPDRPEPGQLEDEAVRHLSADADGDTVVLLICGRDDAVGSRIASVCFKLLRLLCIASIASIDSIDSILFLSLAVSRGTVSD